MLVLLLLLVVAAVAAGILLGQSPSATHDVSFPGMGTYHGADDWVITVAVGAVFALIALMAMAYGSSRIRRLGAANARLRSEIGELRGRLEPEAEAPTTRRRGFFGLGRGRDRGVELDGRQRQGVFGRSRRDRQAEVIGQRMPDESRMAGERERALSREAVPAGAAPAPATGEGEWTSTAGGAGYRGTGERPAGG